MRRPFTIAWLILVFLLQFPLQSYGQVDPVSLVAKDFLQRLLKQLINIEMLRGMGPMEGLTTVNKAYERGKSDADQFYRNLQEKFIKKYESRLKGRNVVHPDPETTKIIDDFNYEMNNLQARWEHDLRELERQREETIETFSVYWEKNPEKLEKY